jgi:hypothetical protein
MRAAAKDLDEMIASWGTGEEELIQEYREIGRTTAGVGRSQSARPHPGFPVQLTSTERVLPFLSLEAPISLMVMDAPGGIRFGSTLLPGSQSTIAWRARGTPLPFGLCGHARDAAIASINGSSDRYARIHSMNQVEATPKLCRIDFDAPSTAVSLKAPISLGDGYDRRHSVQQHRIEISRELCKARLQPQPLGLQARSCSLSIGRDPLST